MKNNIADMGKLKTWQGWLLFAGTMVVVFVLGAVVASMLEHRAEVASVFNNKKVDIKGIEPRNEIFKDNYPREYATWLRTAETDFKASSTAAKLLMCWLNDRNGHSMGRICFSKDYTTPRGHMHAIEDVHRTLRTGAPTGDHDGPQPATCWTCKSPDVPRMMEAVGVDSFITRNGRFGEAKS